MTATDMCYQPYNYNVHEACGEWHLQLLINYVIINYTCTCTIMSPLQSSHKRFLRKKQGKSLPTESMVVCCNHFPASIGHSSGCCDHDMIMIMIMSRDHDWELWYKQQQEKMLDKRIQKRQKFTMDTLQRMPELACRATDGSPAGCVADQPIWWRCQAEHAACRRAVPSSCNPRACWSTMQFGCVLRGW